MKTLLSIAILSLLLMTGCATTKITSTWKAQDVTPQHYNKIMVLGLIRTADRTLQENMENHMVGDLRSMGYNAVSSLQEYGPKAFDNMDEQAAMDKLKNSGVDAVITIVLLDKEKEKSYVPGHIYYYSPYSYYYRHFWGYHTAMYRRIYEPGYYVTNTRFFWESNVYEMNTQKLLYSIQTQSFNPSDSESLGHEYGQLIIKNIAGQGIFQ
ncbi:MAG: hypothetical protein JSU01_00500 [Bacteroidetes bacterium]|nr:hypothetical protein [Bacteroidota bacterium]